MLANLLWRSFSEIINRFSGRFTDGGAERKALALSFKIQRFYLDRETRRLQCYLYVIILKRPVASPLNEKNQPLFPPGAFYDNVTNHCDMIALHRLMGRRTEQV